MKKNLLILAIFFIGCKGDPYPEEKPVKHDTVYIPADVPVHSIITPCKHDSLQVVIDTLAARLLHSRLVISNVKYYLNICIRNPSQDKFLKGWISRAVQ